MKKLGIFILFFFLTAIVFAETIETGKKGFIGIETSTTLSTDLNDGSTGLETKAGIEAIFSLFPREDRGIIPENTDSPVVKIEIKDSSFTWWNTYKTTGGNLEQDDFNPWTAQPLVVNFESLTADVLWKNYYFRVAGTKPDMSLNNFSLLSIFDDVMSASKDRWYVFRKTALYANERYNVLQLPVLGDDINRNLLSLGFQDKVSGQLGLGASFSNWNIDALAGSLKNGKDNNNNSWLFSIDTNIQPIEQINISTDILMGFNLGLDYNNPVALGLGVKYLVNPLSPIKVMPYIGGDGVFEIDNSSYNWEIGGGLFIYFSEPDYYTNHKNIDHDNVIPQGLSLSFNMNKDNESNAIIAFFNDTTKNSLFGNLGGFAQIEMANLIKSDKFKWGLTAQIEYLILNKYKPYIRETIKPNKGDTLYNSVVGLELSPINNY
jgi:hypothetical protein